MTIKVSPNLTNIGETKICDTVAVTGEVYLHQHIGLGRAEQAVHSVSCLYSTVKCKHLQLFVIQTGANSMWRIMSGFVISHGLTPDAPQNYVWNRLRLLKSLINNFIMLFVC